MARDLLYIFSTKNLYDGRQRIQQVERVSIDS